MVGGLLFGGALLPILFVIRFLIGAFFKLPWWRHALLGETTMPWRAMVGLLLAVSAVAWRYFLRRGFVWAEPAVLSWMDFSGHGRSRAVSHRMWAVWCSLILVLAYAGALVAATYQAAPAVWVVASALILTSGLVTLALASVP
ncbi:MAG: hypothetical protein ACJ72N_01470 [Labedaea sp.]